MSSFDECLKIEHAGLRQVIEFLRIHPHEGFYKVPSDTPGLARLLQNVAGDFVATRDDGFFGIEVKTEAENKHGNFYLETWSNRSRFTLGWMYKLEYCRFLLYQFERPQCDIYVIPFEELRRWAFVDGRIYSYPERAQSKHEQMNDTWGRTVPISVIGNEVGFYRCWFEGGKLQVAESIPRRRASA